MMESLRYCWAIARPPLWLLLALGAIVVLVVLNANRGLGDPDGLLVLLLVIQSFSGSTGFSRAALRGHYDPMLLRGRSRVQLAVAHWAAANLPGIGTWLVAICVLRFCGGTSTGFSLRGWLALFLASTVPWALTIPWLPFTGGLLCTLTLVSLGVAKWGTDLLRMVLPGPVTSAFEQWQCAVLLAICPFLFLSPRPQAAGFDATVQIAATGIAIVTVTFAVVHIVRREYPLLYGS